MAAATIANTGEKRRHINIIRSGRRRHAGLIRRSWWEGATVGNEADLQETFADSVTGLIFDGQMLRIEFGVMRLDEVKANAPLTGRRYPTCRLVLPPAAAVDLINRMQRIAEALTQAGVVKTTPRASNEAPIED